MNFLRKFLLRLDAWAENESRPPNPLCYEAEKFDQEATRVVASYGKPPAEVIRQLQKEFSDLAQSRLLEWYDFTRYSYIPMYSTVPLETVLAYDLHRLLLDIRSGVIKFTEETL